MGKKVGLTLEEVVAVASTIADRDGLEAASLSAVAAELGIKTPSLYNHVAGLAGLRRELGMEAARQLAEVFAHSTDEGTPADVVKRAAHGIRDFALEHPGLYAAMFPAPKPGEDDEMYEALAAPVAVLAKVLTEGGLDGDRTIDAIRGLRSMAHGFADLELKGGFGMPIDVDKSFELALDVFVAGALG